MKKLVLGLASLIFLSGCLSNPPMTDAEANMYSQLNSKPTITIECDSGCKATYTDPRDRVKPVKQTNGYDAIVGVTTAVTGAVAANAGFLAIGAVAVEGMKRAANSSVVTDINTSDSSHSEANTVTSSDNFSLEANSTTNLESSNSTETVGYTDSYNTSSTDTDSSDNSLTYPTTGNN